MCVPGTTDGNDYSLRGQCRVRSLVINDCDYRIYVVTILRKITRATTLAQIIFTFNKTEGTERIS